MLSSREHGDDGIGGGDSRQCACRAFATRLNCLGERRLGQVERQHAMPRLRQIRGHAAAHIAQADESDGCHDSPLSTPARGCCASASFTYAWALFDNGALALSSVFGSDKYLALAEFGRMTPDEPPRLHPLDNFLITYRG